MKDHKTLSLIIKMSIPPTISMFIQSLYNLIDSIYITRYDPLAMEAISLVYPIQNIILAIAIGIGIGINAFIATKLGNGRKDTAENGATLGIIISVLHYILVLVIGLILSPIFIKSFNSDEKVTEYALIYINWIIIFSFTTIVQIAMEKVMQADGKMMYPMISLLVGSIMNIVLDPLLIFTFDMGIRGAAIATVIAQVVATGVMVYFIISKKNRIRLRFKNLNFDKNCLRNIYLVGVPSIILNAIPSFMVSIMNYILVGINDTAVTTFGIYYKLQFLVYMPVSGIMQGSLPMLSYAYGAKNKKKFTETSTYSIYISMVVGAFFMALFLIFPKAIMSLFYEDLSNMNYVYTFLRISALSFVFGSISLILASYFQSVQKGFHSLFITILRQFALILPFAFLLSQNLGEIGIYIAIPISEAITALISFIMFTVDRGKRVKKMQTAIQN